MQKTFKRTRDIHQLFPYSKMMYLCPPLCLYLCVCVCCLFRLFGVFSLCSCELQNCVVWIMVGSEPESSSSHSLDSQKECSCCHLGKAQSPYQGMCGGVASTTGASSAKIYPVCDSRWTRVSQLLLFIRRSLLRHVEDC